MNCVDSCGWLEYLADGPNASFYAEAIEDEKARCHRMPASWRNVCSGRTSAIRS